MSSSKGSENSFGKSLYFPNHCFKKVTHTHSPFIIQSFVSFLAPGQSLNFPMWGTDRHTDIADLLLVGLFFLFPA